MSSSTGLTTAKVLAAFSEEISAIRGQVTDTFDDGRRLFVRSVLPLAENVRPGDRLQGGVALKATEENVWLHPYLFRLVCRNGAIMAQAIETRHLADLHFHETEDALRLIREGVVACCDEEVFKSSVHQVQTASEQQVDVLLSLMPFLSRQPMRTSDRLAAAIMERLIEGRDQSRFGLLNAVPSLARDTRDPELRWDLEELGGAIAAGKIPGTPPGEASSSVGRRHLVASPA